jgi:hypothetical protein
MALFNCVIMLSVSVVVFIKKKKALYTEQPMYILQHHEKLLEPTWYNYSCLLSFWKAYSLTSLSQCWALRIFSFIYFEITYLWMGLVDVSICRMNLINSGTYVYM